MADDALNANRMNVNMGGKQPVMRPGWYLNNGLRSVRVSHFSYTTLLTAHKHL